MDTETLLLVMTTKLRADLPIKHISGIYLFTDLLRIRITDRYQLALALFGSVIPTVVLICICTLRNRSVIVSVMDSAPYSCCIFAISLPIYLMLVSLDSYVC
jgi:hypothetical protein